MEKDMSSVERYAMEDKLKFLRGMAFNNASLLLSGRKYENISLSAEMVFDLAEKLFDEAVKRDYLNYGKIKDNRAISKETGKVEVPLEKKGSLEHPLTEKDDVGQKEQELVI